MALLSINAPPYSAYSTDCEDHFSDATEHMREEEFEEALSSPIESPGSDAHDSNDLRTPKKISPTNLNQPVPGAQIATVSGSEENGAKAQKITSRNASLSKGDISSAAEEEDAKTPTDLKPELQSSFGFKEPNLLGRGQLQVPKPIGGREYVEGQDSIHKLELVNPEASMVTGSLKLIESEIAAENSLDYNEEDGEKSDVGLQGENEEKESGEDGGGSDDFGEVIEGEEFNDFEGFEEGNVNNDFGGFNETNQQTLPSSQPPLPRTRILDFSRFPTQQDTLDGVSSLVSNLYPSSNPETIPLRPLPTTTAFLTDRSESLWHQLIAPPPLQPPDWKRSRIRRLFLVSLGVPVDLDEIFPASKQKKLILPSTKRLSPTAEHSNSSSRRNSTDGGAAERSKSRLRDTANGESSSRAQSSSRAGKKGDKSTCVPDFDTPTARILCSTSDAALANFTPEELKEHIANLQKLTNIASEALTYWLKKRDGAMSDKETFETVIESLVGYARKTRQSMR